MQTEAVGPLPIAFDDAGGLKRGQQPGGGAGVHIDSPSQLIDPEALLAVSELV
jgi:hypothetical protein